MNAFLKNARLSIRRPTPAKAFNLFISISILVILLLNVFVISIQNKLALGIDFSAGKIYTLTNITKKTLDNLQEDINIYPVYSSGNSNRIIKEILKKYQVESPFIHIKDLSGASSAILETFRETYDLSGAGIIIANKDHTVSAFLSEGDLYTTDANMNIVGITAESKITSAIDSIEKGAFSQIRLLTGHGETKSDEVSNFLKLLNTKNYMIDTYDLSKSAEALNPKTDILVVISPRADLSEGEYSTLKDFFSLGGRAMLFMDNSSFNEDKGVLQIYMNSFSYFNDLLGIYNLRLNNDLIICKDPSRMNLRSTSISMMAIKHGITEDILQKRLPVVLSEASSIDFTDTGNAITTSLLYTDKSFAKPLFSDLKNLSPTEGDKEGRFIVAALSELDDSKLLLFSTSSCANNDAFAIPGNKALLESSIDFLSPMGTTTSISSKNFGTVSLPSFKTFTRFLLLFASAILPASIILCIGFKKTTRHK